MATLNDSMLMSAFRSHEMELRPPDVLIPIMGSTGAGKSSFLASIIGDDVGVPIPAVGHGLQSCTKKAEGFIFDHKASGHRLLLVDTPGFDDTSGSSDVGVLQQIALCLVQAHRLQIPVAGVLYLHNIRPERMRGSRQRNIKMTTQLLGDNACPYLTLVTTHWDRIMDQSSERKAAQREEELSADEGFWGKMASQIRTRRWQGNGSSASQILDSLMSFHLDTGGHGVTLKIQKELIHEGKPLHETAAAIVVDEKLVAQIQKHLEKQEELRQEHSTTMQRRQQNTGEILQSIQKEEQDIQELQNAQTSLRTDTNSFIELCQAEARDRLEKMQLDAARRERKEARRRQAWSYGIPVLKVLGGVGATVAGGMLLQPTAIVGGLGLIGSGAVGFNNARASSATDTVTRAASQSSAARMDGSFGMVLANDGVDHSMETDKVGD